MAIFELMRLDKPIGIYLLLWPALLALVISSNGNFEYVDLIIVIIGSVSFDYLILPIMSGCLIIISLAILINRFILKKRYPLD